MGKYNHVLKPNKSKVFPRNWLFFDCESRIEDLPGGGQNHTFRLVVGNYHRDSRLGNRKQDKWYYGQNAKAFWLWVLSVCEHDRKLVCIAYNLPYDIRIAKVFPIFAKFGYIQTAIYVSGKVTIIGLKKGRHRIVFIDAMNYFDGKLDSWGRLFDLEKIDVDFRNVTTEKLFEHCRRDVEMLRCLWDSWRVFCRLHNLGHFAPTRASQALGAFTHRFMTRRIFIHACPDVLALERESYCGGRVEAYRIGDCGNGPFYKLDVNSMYPFIMRTLAVPVRYLGLRQGPRICDILKWRRKYGFVGQVDIKTDTPVYPVRDMGRLIFPTGRFTVTLAGPELFRAIDRGDVVAIRQVAIYEKAIIFRSFINYFYKLRQKYKDQGNRIYEQMVKYIMNSLYGKFGQYSEQWKTVVNIFGQEDGTHEFHDLDTGEIRTIMILAGQRWDLLGRREACNGFPAISAYITSAARLMLWDIMCQAGRQNVFYCDTDAVMVNRAGRRRLVVRIDPRKLGQLKQEYRSEQLLIRGLKDYRTDHETKIKGIRPDAKLLAKNTYRHIQWEGLRGAFSKGNLESVLLKPIVKHLSGRYYKGQVSSSGTVSPTVLAL